MVFMKDKYNHGSLQQASYVQAASMGIGQFRGNMDYLTEIVSFFAGLIAGWSLKIVVDRSSKSRSTQKHITAGGDVAGRDINKKN